MSSFDPSQNRLEDSAVYVVEGFFGYHMTKIVRPPSDLWIQLIDECFCRCSWIPYYYRDKTPLKLCDQAQLTGKLDGHQSINTGDDQTQLLFLG
jgi:hypothetical protein